MGVERCPANVHKFSILSTSHLPLKSLWLKIIIIMYTNKGNCTRKNKSCTAHTLKCF